MKIAFKFFLVFHSSFLFSKTEAPSIHSHHWIGSLPLLKTKHVLLVHNIFIVAFDLEKKFPAWLAYHLSPALVWGNLKEERKYVPDPLLYITPKITNKHYKGASHCDKKGKGYQKGHLAPKASFKASPYNYQTQYLTNIVPQSKSLNLGPWKIMEKKVRNFVKKGNELQVLTGPIYGKEGKDKTPPCWKKAQGLWEEIPKAYCKIVILKNQSKIKSCSVLMSQKAVQHNVKKYIVKIKDIEQATNLKILSSMNKSPREKCDFLL